MTFPDLFQLKGEITITTGIKVDDIANSNINNSKEALISFFELLLVKDLHRKHTLFCDLPRKFVLVYFTLVFHHYHLQIEAFIPVRVQSLLYDARGVGLLAIDGGDCERVWKSYIRRKQ